MALISEALTTLASVKSIAGIASSDTSQDAFLELLINSASLEIAGFCDRTFGRADYTENIAATNRQALLLRQWPIVAVSSLTNNGLAYTLNTDYRLDDPDKAQGIVWRAQGWEPKYLVGGLTDDALGKDRTIAITYTAGYYLPGNVNYVAGGATSLPLDVSMVANMMVSDSYFATKNGSYGNLKALSEGGLSYTWGVDSAQYGNLAAGMKDKYATILNRYRRWYVS